MTMKSGKKSIWTSAAGTAFVTVTLLLGIAFFMILNANKNTSTVIKTTPWACVGGCGAGGSGGAGGATAKWIGRGVTGGLLDIQGMYSGSDTKQSVSKALELRFSIKPTYTSILALTVPFFSKTGSLQTTSDQPPITGLINNGIGDIRVDYIGNFGLSGDLSYDFTLSLPTGPYTATTGSDKYPIYLPTSLQLGAGVYNLSLDIGKTIDRDKSMILLDLVYSYPFNINFSGKNQYYDFTQQQKDLMTSSEKKRFYYYFKPYGENDIGGYTPPSLMASAFYGYKGMEDFVHSFGLMFSVPLGVSWIPALTTGKPYDPSPDPDNQVWNATLCYGLEFSKSNFPLFIAAYLPIHAKTASATNAQAGNKYDPTPMESWSRGPEWNDVFHRWSVFMGVKTSLF
jgi:hypothetical protein